jgi:Flp pilus assembly protein TadG
MPIHLAEPDRRRRGFLRGLRGFLRDRSGLSAMEFALLLPLMIALDLGCVEVGNGLSAQFKTTLAARTVADLASQYSTINNATMANILGASSAVLTPFSSANAVVIVSEVTTDAKGNATITWSDALNGTARQAGSSVTLPATVAQPNISLLWGEVTFPYTPQTGYVITGTIKIYQDMYFYPRLGSAVTRVP